jgi:peptidoglycan/xylan/chitin deacetylase (PgdA/CDA1 family)
VTSPTVPVLLYHSVSDQPGSGRFAPQVVPPAALQRDLEAIASHGKRGVPVHELLGSLDAGLPLEGLVGLSFDDGFLDFYEVALPILSRFGFRATLYVPTAFVGKSVSWAPGPDARRPTMSWGHLRDCAAAGTEIGSHGVSHVPLDVLAPSEAMAELTRSRQQLEDELGVPVQSLAYPHGYASPRLARRVRDAGYRSACVIGHRPWRTDRPRTAITRILVRAVPAGHHPAFDPPAAVLVEGVLKQFATPPWRLARRASRYALRLSARSAGDRNSGDRNSGDRNSGDRDAGDRDAGDRNSGDRDAGGHNAGAACGEPPTNAAQPATARS